jgi:hypothetical protein
MSGVAAGDLQVSVVTDGTVCYRRSSTTVAINTWTNVICTFDGDPTDYTGTHIYINNSEVTYSANQNGTGTETASARCAIGSRLHSSDRYLDGYLAELAMWSAVIDSGERNSLTASMSPLATRPQSSIAYWSLMGNLNQTCSKTSTT